MEASREHVAFDAETSDAQYFHQRKFKLSDFRAVKKRARPADEGCESDDGDDFSFQDLSRVSSFSSTSAMPAHVDQIAENMFPVAPTDYEAGVCIICDEHADMLRRQNDADPDGRLGIMKKISDNREVVFAFEQKLRGHKTDDYIFRHMLTLRRRMVEHPLKQFGYRYTPWTMAMLRRHFARHDNPSLNHGHDLIRDLRKSMGRIQTRMKEIEGALYEEDPETGFKKYRVDAAREHRYHEALLQTTQKEYDKAIANHRPICEAVDRRICELIDGFEERPATAQEAIDDMYNVGGI